MTAAPNDGGRPVARVAGVAGKSRLEGIVKAHAKWAFGFGHAENTGLNSALQEKPGREERSCCSHFANLGEQSFCFRISTLGLLFPLVPSSH